MESNCRLLIVDDNRAIHDDFRKVLGPRPGANSKLDAVESALFGPAPAADAPASGCFQIDSAYQGQEGLDLVHQALKRGAPYAMAFVDVRMPPGWDGVETTARFWDADPDLQVVICTAYSDCSWDDMLLKLGRSDRLVILKKPFDHVEVQQLATSLTKKWHLLQDSKKRRNELENIVADRTQQIIQEQEKLRAIFENSPDGIYQSAADGTLLRVNAAFAAIFGYESAGEFVEARRVPEHRNGTDSWRSADLLKRIDTDGIIRQFESEIFCRDGSRKWISLTASKVQEPDGRLRYYQGFVRDITAQKEVEGERNLMEVHLRQAQKLESVGQLAAGIAHEINTPIQYIGDNIRFIDESLASLFKLLDDEHKLVEALRSGNPATGMIAAVEAARQKTDIDYLAAEIPKAIEQSLDGVQRVSKIVSAMKEFSHPGITERTACDLNHSIETTVTVARNEWKYVADVITDYDPNLPAVLCLVGEFNQAILNLVVNAAQAIGDVVKTGAVDKGEIRITTRLVDPWAEIRVSDTGTGIPENIRHRMFEPFFTTKDVGKGTGQGLAIARSTIVNKHGGQLSFESTVGKGTTFIIRLPLRPPTGIPPS